MKINVTLDAKLVHAALELGQHATESEALQCALEHYVRRLKQLKLLELQEKVTWDGNLDEMRKH